MFISVIIYSWHGVKIDIHVEVFAQMLFKGFFSKIYLDINVTKLTLAEIKLIKISFPSANSINHKIIVYNLCNFLLIINSLLYFLNNLQ